MSALNQSLMMTDYEVVLSILEKKGGIFKEEIYHRYAPKIYFTCLGLVKDKSIAKDLSHDIIIKVFLKLNSFKGTADFSFWVHAITKNHCMTYLNKRKKRKTAKIETIQNVAVYMDDLNLEIVKEKEAKLIRLETEFQKLKEEEQFILTQKYFEHCSIRNLAFQLKISECAVKMRLKRSREKLKKMMLKAK